MAEKLVRVGFNLSPMVEATPNWYNKRLILDILSTGERCDTPSFLPRCLTPSVGMGSCHLVSLAANQNCAVIMVGLDVLVAPDGGSQSNASITLRRWPDASAASHA